jgi:hypothetical protein
MPTRTTPKTRARRAAPSRGVRALRVGVLLAVLVAASSTASSTAWAAWTALGGGTGRATTGTLVAPSALTATSVSGPSSVGVAWSAPSTGVAPNGYRVDRTDTTSGSTVAACGSSSSSLVSGTSCTDASVPDGTYRYTVVAVRSGWTATSATSSPVTVLATVTTSVSLTSSATPVLVGQSVTYTATVSAASGAATGSVVFRDGGTAITCTGGSQTLSSGVATCITAFGSSGTRSITAAYAGSAPYGASTSSALSQGVDQRAQSIAFSSTAPTGATGGGTYTVVATASSGLPVTFSSSTTAVCTVTGSTVTFVGAGTCTVLADQAGSTAYLPAPQQSQTFSVAKSSQSVTFTTPPPSSATMGDAAYTVSATASSGLQVVFTTATPNVCTVSGSTVSYVAAGTCVVNADQSGNAGYNAAPRVTQSFFVASAPSAPTNVSVTVSGVKATGTWTSVTGYTYECQNTNGNSAPISGAWFSCASGATPFDPKSGQQTFWVRGLRGGIVTDMASYAFKA